MATLNMNLSLPTPTVTIGPDWATQLNAALETVDEHDHSSGKGVKITPAGLNINTTLDLQDQDLINVNTFHLVDLSATLTGASYARSIQAVNGNLYFVNNAGNAVQITDGGAIVAAPGGAQSFETQAVTSDIVIGAGDSFVRLAVDTTTARQITLPLASSVVAGRLYIILDQTGSARANNITIVPQGADTIQGVAGNFVLRSDKEAVMITGDGSGAWDIV